MRIYTIILILMLLISCSKEKERIEFLKDTLQIELNSEVKVLENESVQAELFLPDYTLTLKIELTKNQIEKITDQITEVPYFNELDYFKWKDNSRYLQDNDGLNFETIQDSIAKTKYRGSWIKTKEGFEFVDCGKSHDMVLAWINTNTNTLKFEFTDM
jgi:hypothetical protein